MTFIIDASLPGPSSRNAKAALEKAVKRFGKGITVVNDNGSEYMKDAEAFLREHHITQYWTRPKSPKEQPLVERLIGAFQKECLDYHYEPMDARELAELTDSWMDKAPAAKTGFFAAGETSAPMNP